MKRLGIFLVAAMAMTACTSTDKKSTDGEMTPEQRKADSLKAVERQKAMADTANYTTIQWLDSMSVTLPTAKEGDPVNVSWRFKNTGDKPLVVANVSASCGCTVPEKPEEPIAPGAEGVIKAKFDSKGKKGHNEKHVTVDANTKPSRSHELEFQVEVQ